MVDNTSLIILGGTFDPVHHGHLRLASELQILLPQAEIRLMPSGQPPHRTPPQASAKHRLKMLQLAVVNSKNMTVDDFEVTKNSPSYSIETLFHLRQTIPKRAIIWVLGNDAYQELGRWQRVSELSNLCHLLVVNRAGNYAQENKSCHGFSQVESLEQLHTKPAGLVFQLELPLLEISSTRIRQLIKNGNGARWLLPDVVNNYITFNSLYKRG